MNALWEKIKERRQVLGLSQMQLATMSELSLPTLQNIENGKANPEWSSLSLICKNLGIDFDLKVRAADWDLLAYCGAPLAPTAAMKKIKAPRSAELLVSAVLDCASECHLNSERVDGRMRDSLQALILAVYLYYPTLYKKRLSKSTAVSALLASGESSRGRLVKLKRIAYAFICKYL